MIPRRSNQSILKEISPGISLEGMTLKLKLQYFGHLMRRVDSLEKTLMLGGIGGRRRRGRQDEMAGWHHWLDGRESEWTQGVGDGQGGLASCDSWGREESDTTEQLNWTEHGIDLNLYQDYMLWCQADSFVILLSWIAISVALGKLLNFSIPCLDRELLSKEKVTRSTLQSHGLRILLQGIGSS